MPKFSSLVILLLLMETTFETKFLGLWQNGIYPFWFSFGYSFNHIFLTLLPSNQFLNQLTIHDYSLINKLSMICFGDHHSKLIAKILHLILLINN
jgi:hypothetical protein